MLVFEMREKQKNATPAPAPLHFKKNTLGGAEKENNNKLNPHYMASKPGLELSRH